MNRSPLFLFLAAACATEPSSPTAPVGSDAWAQQNYLQALEKCQQAHRGDSGPDAGMGVLPTSADEAFSACLQKAKEDLARAQGADAGHR